MARQPEKTGRQQAGKFAPGVSGNPDGRPRGARHKTTLAIEALLEGQHEALTQKAIDLALAGDGPRLGEPACRGSPRAAGKGLAKPGSNLGTVI